MPLTRHAARRITGSVTATDRARTIRIIAAEVATLRALGEPIREESIRHFAARLGMPAAELSAAVGTWPACAGD